MQTTNGRQIIRKIWNNKTHTTTTKLLTKTIGGIYE
jgi:hypothetical protein